MELLVAIVGAFFGAGFAALAALWVTKRERVAETQAAQDALDEALRGFTVTLSPFLMITDEEIERRSFAEVRDELLEAHEQLDLVTSLVELTLERDRVLGPKTLLGLLGILKTLRREQDLWDRERSVISGPRASRNVLQVHVSKLRSSASKMNTHAYEALASISRKPPVFARAAVTEGDDTLSATAIVGEGAGTPMLRECQNPMSKLSNAAAKEPL